jgi:hypothetical protein
VWPGLTHFVPVILVPTHRSPLRTRQGLFSQQSILTLKVATPKGEGEGEREGGRQTDRETESLFLKFRQQSGGEDHGIEAPQIRVSPAQTS